MPARRREGAFFEIALPNNKFSYGRILAKANYAFYDIYSDQPLTDIEMIGQAKVLFIIAVYKHVITKGLWKQIGIKALEPALQKLPMTYIKDPISPDTYRLYDPNTGVMTPCTKADCKGMEVAAVYDKVHAEDRLVAHFENRPGRWPLDRL